MKIKLKDMEAFEVKSALSITDTRKGLERIADQLLDDFKKAVLSLDPGAPDAREKLFIEKCRLDGATMLARRFKLALQEISRDKE